MSVLLALLLGGVAVRYWDRAMKAEKALYRSEQVNLLQAPERDWSLEYIKSVKANYERKRAQLKDELREELKDELRNEVAQEQEQERRGRALMQDMALQALQQEAALTGRFSAQLVQRWTNQQQPRAIERETLVAPTVVKRRRPGE